VVVLFFLLMPATFQSVSWAIIMPISSAHYGGFPYLFAAAAVFMLPCTILLENSVITAEM